MPNPIEEKIRAVRWEKYTGPEFYRPGRLVQALVDLAMFDESRTCHDLANEVLFAVGNNHSGTYYPAVLEAVDILTEIERTSDVTEARSCARAILNDLYYFGAEVGTYTGHSPKQIESFVRQRLEPYANES